MMTALVTNEKWSFQFPWCRTLGVHPPLREGCRGKGTLRQERLAGEQEFRFSPGYPG